MTELVPAAELVPTNPLNLDTLAALELAAADHLQAVRPVNTSAAYAGDWRTWEHYCGDLGIPTTSATLGALVGFVVWLQDKPPSPRDLARNPRAPRVRCSPATISRRVNGVIVGLQAQGVLVDPRVKLAVRQAVTAYDRQLSANAESRGTGEAPPVLIGHLHRVAATTPNTLAGARDLALVLLGWRFASRESEVARLLVPDVQRRAQGLLINVRAGKTGDREVPIKPAQNPDICPIRAWDAWVTRAELTEGPAFRPINRHDQLRPGPLSGAAVGHLIVRVFARAGVDARGHSLRAGLITEARRAGHDAKTVSGISGHSPTSPVLWRYFREVDQWDEAPDLL
jgi:hypothetical protein